jgi:hypothetical protein
MQWITDSGSSSYSGGYLYDGGTKWLINEIVTGTRHDGTTGPMFHQGTLIGTGSVRQNPYIINPTNSNDFYVSYWLKWPSNLASLIGGWYTFSEVKTSWTGLTGENYDYRIAIYIYKNSNYNGQPYFSMTGTEHSAGPYYWTQQADPSVYPVPLGSWFLFEWYVHRGVYNDPNSETWVKINGQTIMDQKGGGTLTTGFWNSTAKWNRIFLWQQYGGAVNTWDQWTDHVEIWTP